MYDTHPEVLEFVQRLVGLNVEHIAELSRACKEDKPELYTAVCNYFENMVRSNMRLYAVMVAAQYGTEKIVSVHAQNIKASTILNEIDEEAYKLVDEF
jgi:hypothetical protein